MEAAQEGNRLKGKPIEVILIPAADKLHHARAILSDFIDEGDRRDSPSRTRVALHSSGTTANSSRSTRSGYRRATHDLEAVIEQLADRMGEKPCDVPKPE